MNYQGMYRSNEVQVDRNKLENLFGEQFEKNHAGIHFENKNTLWLGDTATTFDVWGGQWAGELPEEYGYVEDGEITELWLELVSEALEDGEELVVRSVGFTGLRHIPDAFEWRVDSNGNVEYESL